MTDKPEANPNSNSTDQTSQASTLKLTNTDIEPISKTHVTAAEQRQLILMRFVDDMSLAEIAGALDVPVGTVKSRLYNSLKTLKDDEREKRYFLD